MSGDAGSFDDGPLDGTRLAADIAATVPGANARMRHDEWRADLKRRVAERLAARAGGGSGENPT